MLPEIRKDPLSGRWVIVAPNRASRPQDVALALTGMPNVRACPFCPGGELDTPGEILAVRPHDSPANGLGWRVRVVPNKFPAVMETLDSHPPKSPHEWSLPGFGVHEVIIESPRHLHSNTEQSVAELQEVFWVYRERLRMLAAGGKWQYGLIFKNVGFAAGASLEHLHSQLVALPIVPVAIEETLAATAEFYAKHGCCYYCNLIERELAQQARIVADNSGFVALCPYASRFSYETWLVPRRHQSVFTATEDEELFQLAEMVHSVLRKLEGALDKPAYNLAIRTAPLNRPSAEHYHWHVEIFPRITRLAGFELSTDFYINIVRPEDAAARLRSVI